MKASVIIPTHNRKSKLLALLTSLESQVTTDFEVIVSDDASTDGTKDAVSEYKTKSRLELKYLHQEKKGPAAARNIAIRKSDSDLVILLNDDVIADKNLVSEHVRFHENNPDASALGWIKPAKGTMNGWAVFNSIHFPYHTIPYNLQNLPFIYFITANALVERHTLFDAGLFDEDYPKPAAEDIDMGYRLMKKGVRLIFNRKAIVYHDHPRTVDEYARQQRMMGFELGRFVKKHHDVNITHSVVEANAEEIRKEASQQIKKEYGISLSPNTLRILLSTEAGLFTLKKYVQYGIRVKSPKTTASLQRLVSAYYLQKGYEEFMKAQSNNTTTHKPDR